MSSLASVVSQDGGGGGVSPHAYPGREHVLEQGGAASTKPRDTPSSSDLSQIVLLCVQPLSNQSFLSPEARNCPQRPCGTPSARSESLRPSPPSCSSKAP
jgi:hypothetical protein